MKKVLLGALLSVLPAIAWADGDGVDIIPFSSSGDVISGTVTVYGDGSASIVGQCMGAAFTALGHASRNSDGSWDFGPILSDGDLIRKQKSWIPLQIHFTGTPADGSDGDDTNNNAGRANVDGQGAAGKGEIRLTD